MRHRPRCTKIYSIRKLANARVRNFYAYENFCDYSTMFFENIHFYGNVDCYQFFMELQCLLTFVVVVVVKKDFKDSCDGPCGPDWAGAYTGGVHRCQ